MKIVIFGIDGYLGWTLAVRLASKGYNIIGMDNLLRRELVRKVGSESISPLDIPHRRVRYLSKVFDCNSSFIFGNITSKEALDTFFTEYKPDVIFHFAEIPSAPYSMISNKTAWETHENNLKGTLNLLYSIKKYCPEAHLIKLGTMGEYGTPNMPIPEGFFEVEFLGGKDILPFPKQARSWYHQTKVHDSHNIMMACSMWGLKVTDVMQGIVYGAGIKEMEKDVRLMTRLDFDNYFGTVVHRFCAQAVIGSDITLYGGGGQKRSFLPLEDSIKCLELIMCNPHEGGYRVVNQFDRVHSIRTIAQTVVDEASAMKLSKPTIRSVDNYRLERHDHLYAPINETLKSLGYTTSSSLPNEVRKIIKLMIKNKDILEKYKDVLKPHHSYLR
jgi:nucleoside-diphosphate-sugar epimerase